MVFEPKTIDFEKSPYTGLVRESWIEAGEYLLQGIFGNIKSFDDPVVMPRKETKVTYPHSADAVREQKAEYFEGLARSFFIAAPLTKPVACFISSCGSISCHSSSLVLASALNRF